MAMFHSAWTVIVFVTFIGIVLWAWNGKRKVRFDEAARLPLEDDIPHKPDSGKPE